MSENSEPSDGDSGAQSGIDLPGGESNRLDDGESRPAPEGDRRVGAALVFLLVGVAVLGVLRPIYPGLATMAIALLLSLFGVLVGVLAFRERGQE